MHTASYWKSSLLREPQDFKFKIITNSSSWLSRWSQSLWNLSSGLESDAARGRIMLSWSICGREGVVDRERIDDTGFTMSAHLVCFKCRRVFREASSIILHFELDSKAQERCLHFGREEMELCVNSWAPLEKGENGLNPILLLPSDFKLPFRNDDMVELDNSVPSQLTSLFAQNSARRYGCRKCEKEFILFSSLILHFEKPPEKGGCEALKSQACRKMAEDIVRHIQREHNSEGGVPTSALEGHRF